MKKKIMLCLAAMMALAVTGFTTFAGDAAVAFFLIESPPARLRTEMRTNGSCVYIDGAV